MNKIHLILLITLLLLITLSSGCSPSAQEFKDTIQNLNEDIQKNDRQIKDEISVVKNELIDLQSSLDDTAQNLNSEMQNNDNKTRDEISGIKNELIGLKSSLDKTIQNLNEDIKTNYSQVRDEISGVKNELIGLKAKLDNTIQIFDIGTLESNSISKNGIPIFNEKIQEFIVDIKKSDDQLGNSISALDNDIRDINANINKASSKQQLYWVIAILIMFLFIASAVLFMRYRINRLDNTLSSQFTSDLEKLNKEVTQMDMKLVNFMEGNLEADAVQHKQQAEPDHSLPIKVCEEIQRMRNRMKHMDQDDQATKVFRKRLESLEEKLNDMGYEMVNLEGKPFIEGMTVNAQFIADENLKDGERIISRIIKPQIMYKSQLIQAGDIEVRQGV